MSSQGLWTEARANSFRSDAAPDVNGTLLSSDFYEAVLQRAKRDRAVFLKSLFTRLFAGRKARIRAGRLQGEIDATGARAVSSGPLSYPRIREV